VKPFVPLVLGDRGSIGTPLGGDWGMQRRAQCAPGS